MKAVIQDGYGPPDKVLSVGDVPRPTVGDDEVLVRVRAASINADVWHAVTGRPYLIRVVWTGARRPKRSIPGLDLAGQVESVGRCVHRFSPGDEVFGESLIGLSVGNGGTFAEYASVPAQTLARKPVGVTFEEAAAASVAGLIALMTLPALGEIGPGHRVLINGAGGAVGSVAIQLLKASGAHVTAIDNATKLAMMRALGADRVIDYTTENVTAGAERFDGILDVASTLSIAAWKRLLNPTGIYCQIGHNDYGAAGGRMFGGLPRVFALLARASFDRQLPRPVFKLPPKSESLATLRRLLDERTLTPIVTRTFPLTEVVSALRCLEEGRTPGRIVITP